MEYAKGYTLLFNGITDALEALARQDTAAAEAILKRAQIDAEEWYLSEEESGEE